MEVLKINVTFHQQIVLNINLFLYSSYRLLLIINQHIYNGIIHLSDIELHLRIGDEDNNVNGFHKLPLEF